MPTAGGGVVAMTSRAVWAGAAAELRGVLLADITEWNRPGVLVLVVVVVWVPGG